MDPGVKANFSRLLGWIYSGLPLPLASVRNRRSLIYVGQSRRRDRALCGAPRGTRTLSRSDEESVSLPSWWSRIARALGARQGSFPRRRCFCVSPE